jgi:hypothetical protein
MRSFVIKFTINIGIALILCNNQVAISDWKQSEMATCVCKPSPPGGTTTCDRSQIAICGANQQGQCEGRCVSYRAAPSTLWAVAIALNAILKTNITDEQLQREHRLFVPIIQKVLDSTRTGKIVTIKYKKHQLRGYIGLDWFLRRNFKDAIRMLGGKQ